jgi:2,3-bisphosphoglycerate-independent phosphoglycerate mutase
LKAILVIADGMADRPVKELDWKTPLEAARKPSLDEIAKTGICGIIDPISPGKPPGSDTATLALLGYNALRVYSGRGALEALGSGVKVLPSDVAFRCNFATVNDKMVILDRRAGRIANEDAVPLAQALQKVKLKKSFGVEFLFRNTIQHRNVLSLRGPKLSTAVGDTDPGRVDEKPVEMKPLHNSSEAKLTARIVNALMFEFHRVLKTHPVNQERIRRGLPPANVVLCRGAGTIPNIKPLSQVYGIGAACVAATPLVRGVCKSAGMDVIEVKGITGTPQTDYMAKAKAATQVLRRYDFVLLHVKATDVASHDRNPKQKIEVIEKIDGMLGYMLGQIDSSSTYIAVTADHTTSTLTGNHEGDPVPVAITGPYVRRDDVETFGERSCAKGGLNRIRGRDLMPIIMNLLDKTAKFGA